MRNQQQRMFEEPNIVWQIDRDFYSQLLTKTEEKGIKTVFYFRKKEGFERFEAEKYDWYISTAVEKLEKVTEDRHLIDWDVVWGLRMAIRERANKDFQAKGHELPNCRNTVQAIVKWSKSTLEKWI